MEYPTKFNKYRRLKEKEALSKFPSKDESSSSNEFPMLSSARMSSITMIPDTCTTLTSNCSIIPVETGMFNDVVMKEDDDCHEEEELPLNLTISSAKKQTRNEIQNSPSCRQKIGRTVEGNSNVCSYNTGGHLTEGLTENMIIEEHFQRSLGSSYFKLFDQSSPRSESVASSDSNNSKAGHKSDKDVMKTVSGSVDDHFSKSLGDVWAKLKTNHLPKELDRHPSSVDDHFAKALGEMWYKIQAEKDPMDQSNSPHLSPKTCPSSTASSFVQS